MSTTWRLLPTIYLFKGSTTRQSDPETRSQADLSNCLKPGISWIRHTQCSFHCTAPSAVSPVRGLVVQLCQAPLMRGNEATSRCGLRSGSR